jgi:PKD repeat protein
VSGTCNPAVSSNAALLTITTPLASFSVNNANQCLSDNSFQFTNTSNTNVGTLYYSWNFGDGEGTSTVINPTYTYKNPGTYFVKLVSVTNSGVKDSAMKTIVVYPKPNPSFTINSKEQCLLNNSFEFTNTTVVSAAPIFGFNWNFGNGSVSSNISPVKSFTTPGTYNVKLVATTFYGCTDSITQQVIVDSMPLVNLITSNGTILCNGATLTIAATGGESYQWYKDGTIIPNQTASNLVLSASGV